MKPTPLLDFWQKPTDAGRPVAVFATTFALEPDFFEQNCLARFLEVSSVNENTGSVDDIIAAIELEDLLKEASVTVLADRSAPAQRTSLLWDLLTCSVPGGLLHAKVAVLLWENATRVVIGSANLTSAGYRRQIELGLTADLGNGCLLPRDALRSLADELQSYLPLIPGYSAQAAVVSRASDTLQEFRRRVERQVSRPTALRVACAPTNAGSGPLEQFDAAWHGPKPLRATHLSPFWDGVPAALHATRRLLTGRPADHRSQDVAVVLGPAGQTAFPWVLADTVSSVRELKPLDQEVRLLHAKCLLIESDEWVAALVGSSNHTRAGLGLAPARHREINLWLGAARASKEGRALLDLVQLGRRVPAAADEVEPTDEDESAAPALPPFFGLCTLEHGAEDGWQLRFSIDANQPMPDEWDVSIAGDRPLLSRAQWNANGAPPSVAITLARGALPTYLLVRWDGGQAPWAVVAQDRQSLPLGPELASLRASQLLEALASGRTVADVIRAELESRATGNAGSKILVDPLTRFASAGSLLRRGRALAASLDRMKRRLERPVVTVDALRARLVGPLGPEFIAVKIVKELENAEQPQASSRLTRADALFTIAEIALTVGRVNWLLVTEHLGRGRGVDLVQDTLERLEALVLRAGAQPATIADYARRALEEARQCLPS